MQLINLNSAYFLKQNDTATQIQMKVVDYDGLTPIALDGFASLEVVIGSELGRFVTKTPTLLLESGAFEFGLDEGDILPSGTQRLEFHMISLNGERRVAPSKGFYKMKVEQGIDEFQAVVTTVTLQLALDSIEEQSTGLQGQYDEFISVAQPLVDASVGAVTDAETALANANTSLATSQQVLVDVGNTIPLAQEATNQADSVRILTEAERVATEAVRLATESVRVATEAVRVATENERLATQGVRQDTEAVRLATDSIRQATEAVRSATDLVRSNTETIRQATDAVRIATETERLASVNERLTFREQQTGFGNRVTAVETKATNAETVANLAKARADLIIAQAGNANTEIVDSRLGADLVARPTAGDLVREIHANQLETARQTTTLVNGVSVVSGGVDALAETEIEGRTLISLGNSNLEASKQYVVADKKTKVIVDNVTQSGVAKFTKGTTTVSTANYLNKVAGSTVANPHISKRVGNQSTLQTPTGTWAELLDGAVATGYGSMATLNGSSVVQTTTGAGLTSQMLFSFDIIAEIERKLGIIPKSTLADKIKWIQDNVDSLTANWHGFGSSVGGNKATLARWSVTALDWSGYDKANIFHTAGTVTKLSALWLASDIALGGAVDANGFAHFLAYAEPSDGVTASSISTDYIDLVVTLKATAQLNTRPTIIRVENFEGKVSGSVVENVHVIKTKGDVSLLSPANFINEWSQGGYDLSKKLDGSVGTTSTVSNGQYAQHLFSFNLIEAVERNVGKIPRTSVADKVQWLKNNVSKLTANWHGFGSSVGGNKATFQAWNSQYSAWSSSAKMSHTSASATKLSLLVTTVPIAELVDSNGFIHTLSYAEASDGVTPSTINTDYIDLEIELKPTADFTRPKVALYEVTADSYAKILVDWNADAVVNRYPIVEGVQHLQGVGVIAEGENLLPPFTEWTLHANAKVISPYELELNATGIGQSTIVDIPTGGLRDTYLSITHNSIVNVRSMDANKAILQTHHSSSAQFFVTKTHANAVFLRIEATSVGAGTLSFKNPMLNLGNVAKPFVPRNPSYLFADVKLGAIGTVADRLYEQDGSRFVRKVVEKDVVLDGSLTWNAPIDYVGHKRFQVVMLLGVNDTGNVIKADGKLLAKGFTSLSNSGDGSRYSDGNMYVSIHDTDTGFGETFVPSSVEIKAYFYGWKMNNGTYGTNYEATGTKTWIPIGDTTNARAVTVVPTSASPTQLDGTIQPYKLSYVLATPQIVNVTDKVEGSLKVNGLTQVEALSGIVRREKVVPIIGASNLYRINDNRLAQTSWMKRKVLKHLAVYKNGIKDSSWTINPNIALSNGNEFLASADFDPTAEYTVTYIALDKPLLTANPTNIKLLYANNMRSALEDLTGKTQDGLTMLSIHEKAIVDLYVRVKALGG